MDVPSCHVLCWCAIKKLLTHSLLWQISLSVRSIASTVLFLNISTHQPWKCMFLSFLTCVSMSCFYLINKCMVEKQCFSYSWTTICIHSNRLVFVLGVSVRFPWCLWIVRCLCFLNIWVHWWLPWRSPFIFLSSYRSFTIARLRLFFVCLICLLSEIMPAGVGGRERWVAAFIIPQGGVLIGFIDQYNFIYTYVACQTFQRSPRWLLTYFYSSFVIITVRKKRSRETEVWKSRDWLPLYEGIQRGLPS